jgi:hypothetical protein
LSLQDFFAGQQKCTNNLLRPGSGAQEAPNVGV